MNNPFPNLRRESIIDYFQTERHHDFLKKLAQAGVTLDGGEVSAEKQEKALFASLPEPAPDRS